MDDGTIGDSFAAAAAPGPRRPRSVEAPQGPSKDRVGGQTARGVGLQHTSCLLLSPHSSGTTMHSYAHRLRLCADAHPRRTFAKLRAVGQYPDSMDDSEKTPKKMRAWSCSVLRAASSGARESNPGLCLERHLPSARSSWESATAIPSLRKPACPGRQASFHRRNPLIVAPLLLRLETQHRKRLQHLAGSSTTPSALSKIETSLFRRGPPLSTF